MTTGTTPGGSRTPYLRMIEFFAQLHAVDRHELAIETKLLVDDAAERTADVAVDHQERAGCLSSSARRGKPHYRARHGGEPRVFRCAGPGKCERDAGVGRKVDEAGGFRKGRHGLVSVDVA